MIDPSAAARMLRVPPARFKLNLHAIPVEEYEPNGDRYVIEVIDLDDSIEMGSVLVISQEQPERPGDPMADPRVERRGVIAGVVVSAGDGHLLGLPDPAFYDKGEENDLVYGRAQVPMFFGPGDVVLVDHNAKGRSLRVVGREVRIVNQIDVLACVRGVRLKRTEEGGWERE